MNFMYQANFIMVYTAFTKLGYLNKEAEVTNLKGMSFLNGIEKPPPRSEKCFKEVRSVCDVTLTLFFHYSFKEPPSSTLCTSRNNTTWKVLLL